MLHTLSACCSSDCEHPCCRQHILSDLWKLWYYIPVITCHYIHIHEYQWSNLSCYSSSSIVCRLPNANTFLDRKHTFVEIFVKNVSLLSKMVKYLLDCTKCFQCLLVYHIFHKVVFWIEYAPKEFCTCMLQAILQVANLWKPWNGIKCVNQMNLYFNMFKQ